MSPRQVRIIGRGREIRQLREIFSSIGKSAGGSAFVVGEAGAGKSRLAEDLADHATRYGGHVLSGRTSVISTAGGPYRALTEALLTLVRRGLGPFDELGPYTAVLARLIPDWRTADQPSIAADPPVIVAEGVLRLLGMLGRAHGCLLVLEDLHDADAETLAVVEYLVDNIATQPAMLLCTTRQEPGRALDLADHVAYRPRGCRVAVAGLDRSDTVAMLAEFLRVRPEGVPTMLAQRLWSETHGNPFMIEELLRSRIEAGVLVRRRDGWHMADTPPSDPPHTVTRSVLARTDRIGPNARDVFRVAALLGDPFPATLAAEAAGVGTDESLAYFAAAVTAQLIVADPDTPGWYRFAHPLTAHALRAAPGTHTVAALAERAADRIEADHPELPENWCQRVARLREHAGQLSAAGVLFLELGRRALRAGAADSACSLLSHARELVAGSDPGTRLAVVSELLAALGAAGRFEQAFAEATQLDDHDAPGEARARLHLTLAQLAADVGRLERSRAEIGRARELLGPAATAEQTAPVDAVTAELTLDLPGEDRIEVARTLARNAVKALDGGDDVSLPRIVCSAWQVLGMTWGTDDLAEAQRCFARAAQVADAHGLPYSRLAALTRAAGNHWLWVGESRRLHEALSESNRIGDVVNAYTIRAMLDLDAVLRGCFEEAADLDDVLSELAGLNVTGICCYAQVVRAVREAHRGRRAEMQRSLREFRRLGGLRSRELPLAYGMAEAFCALLEERRPEARQALSRAHDAEAADASTYHLSGSHGIGLLLGVLDHEVDETELRRRMATVSGRLCWNRHFTRAALGVLHGRAGRYDEAAEDVEAALDDAVPHPLARHLVCRLVAGEAYEHGWGRPVAWTRQAEEYFFAAGIVPVTGACRALLRQMGAAVRQRRAGTDRIPEELRLQGVTGREYEILELVAIRWSNREIATHLHLSLRTVEKHVANLLAKTGHARRAELHGYAGDRDDPTPTAR